MARGPRGVAVESSTEANANLQLRAERLVAEILRPLIAADGGEIELISVSKTQLRIRLSGTCAGCPGRPYTMHGVVERAAHKVLGPDVHVDLAEP